MTTSRARKWLSIPGVAGGFMLFLIEGLIVTTLALVAWLLSLAVLAAL